MQSPMAKIALPVRSTPGSSCDTSTAPASVSWQFQWHVVEWLALDRIESGQTKALAAVDRAAEPRPLERGRFRPRSRGRVRSARIYTSRAMAHFQIPLDLPHAGRIADRLLIIVQRHAEEKGVEAPEAIDAAERLWHLPSPVGGYA